MQEKAISAEAEEADAANIVAPIWRHPAFATVLMIAGLLAWWLPAWWPVLSDALFDIEQRVAQVLPEEFIANAGWVLLPLVGFLAGVLASFSPCIMPLIPLNLALIGASQTTGKRAVILSGQFVLGAALALAVLGLAGDFAGWILIDQRGPVFIVVSVLLFYFGLVAAEWVSMPNFEGWIRPGKRLGPFATGAVFSLVTTPCASPLLAALLAASAAQAIPGLTVTTLVFFALGYTALVFLAGVFGGGVVKRFQGRFWQAPRAMAAGLLLVAAGGFGAAGVAWF